MKKRIYVLRQCLADNIQQLATMRVRDHFKLKPVTVVDFPDDESVPPLACHEVEIHGPCKLVYYPNAPKARPGHPLNLILEGVAPLGTKIWVETTAELTILFWDPDQGTVKRTVY